MPDVQDLVVKLPHVLVPREAGSLEIQIEQVDSGVDAGVDQIDVIHDLALGVWSHDIWGCPKDLTMLAVLFPRLEGSLVGLEVEVSIKDGVVRDSPEVARVFT